ncbi:hypothetical protein HpDR147_14520 [Helicobacter pylori]
MRADFTQEHETQLTQLKTSTQTQKNELETSFNEQMNHFQSEWNKKQETFIQEHKDWIKKFRKHNQKIDDERSYSRGYGR